MLRPIWSHPECPTKEDIRDELRRSEVKAILPHSDFPVLEKRPLILALVPQTVGIRCAIISRVMTPTIERLLRDYDCGEIPRRNFLLSLAPLTAGLRGMAQSSAPTIPLRALNHVTLTVSDVKRSLEFYQGLFGMPIQNRQTSMSASLQIGLGPQHIGLGRGGANAKPGINHFCVTTDNFEVDRILQVLAAHGVTKLDPLDANFPARGGALKSRVRIRREDAGGTKEGTPELYFTDPDGIVVQLQHTSYCAGSGYLGEVCPNKPEPAPTRGVLALRDLNHVTLGVSNQQRSREFYRDLFGMKVQAYQGPSPVHAIGSGPQFMAFGAGSANGGIPRTPNIAHFCMTVDKFELDRVLKALADFGVKPRGNSAGPVVPLTSYVSMRMEDRGGAREGTPELYFTDPDGIVVQLQDTRYCGGAGYLGDVCRP